MSADARTSACYLACRDCGEPLEIVCPTHGRTVSRILPDRPAPKQELPAKRPHLREGSRRHQILQLMVNDGGEFTAKKLSAQMGISELNAGVELCGLAEVGFITRVWRGVYRAKPVTPG